MTDDELAAKDNNRKNFEPLYIKWKDRKDMNKDAVQHKNDANKKTFSNQKDMNKDAVQDKNDANKKTFSNQKVWNWEYEKVNPTEVLKDDYL